MKIDLPFEDALRVILQAPPPPKRNAAPRRADKVLDNLPTEPTRLRKLVEIVAPSKEETALSR